jgi:hypothetical protein
MGDGKLTDAGWPRPIINGWPIPWVSPSDDLSTMNLARSAACASGAVCAVCGIGYQDDEEAYVLVKSSDAPASLDGVFIRPMDNGILHKGCLKLALGRCPELRRLAAAGDLQIVKTVGNDTQIKIEGEEVSALIDGKDCAVVARKDL